MINKVSASVRKLTLEFTFIIYFAVVQVEANPEHDIGLVAHIGEEVKLNTSSVEAIGHCWRVKHVGKYERRCDIFPCTLRRDAFSIPLTMHGDYHAP